MFDDNDDEEEEEDDEEDDEEEEEEAKTSVAVEDDPASMDVIFDRACLVLSSICRDKGEVKEDELVDLEPSFSFTFINFKSFPPTSATSLLTAVIQLLE